MLSKCAVILLLVALNSSFIYGAYFRKNYVFVEELNNFYKISTDKRSWAEARIKCELEGASLFYPVDENEATIVTKLWNEQLPHSEEIYIGVADWNVKDDYEAVDGTSISDIYNSWADGQPEDTTDGGCVIMQKDVWLKVEDCASRFNYICKKSLDTVEWNDKCNIPDPDYVYNSTLDRCYKFHLNPRNWTDAFTVCEAEESYLTIINTVSEDKFLIALTAAAPKDDIGGDYLRGAVHIGFRNYSGYWETIKGVPLEDSGFGWTGTQPDGAGSETCGSMFYTGELNDIGCWQKMFFICEHEVVASTRNVTLENEQALEDAE